MFNNLNLRLTYGIFIALECCPQNNDLLSNIFSIYCLLEEVCRMLNTTKNKSWKHLLTIIRQDMMIEQWSNNGEQNPALLTIWETPIFTTYYHFRCLQIDDERDWTLRCCTCNWTPSPELQHVQTKYLRWAKVVRLSTSITEQYEILWRYFLELFLACSASNWLQEY